MQQMYTHYSKCILKFMDLYNIRDRVMWDGCNVVQKRAPAGNRVKPVHKSCVIGLAVTSEMQVIHRKAQKSEEWFLFTSAEHEFNMLQLETQTLKTTETRETSLLIIDKLYKQRKGSRLCSVKR